MKSLKFYLFLFILSLAFLPAAVHAESILYLECYSQDNCGLCDVLELVNKVARFILSLTGSLSLLMLVISGVILITSQGVAGRIDIGKKIIYGSIIGLGITYFAWVGVNFVIYSAAGSSDATSKEVATIFTRPWNEFKCIHETEKIIDTPDTPENPPVVPPDNPVDGPCKSAWEAGNERSCGGSCGGLSTSNIKPEQCQDASPDLVDVLTCLHDRKNNYTLLKNKDLIITSISDDGGLKKCRDSWTDAGCFHMQKSCHYGGFSKETNGSYAVDLRRYSATNSRQNFNTNEEVALRSLVRSCYNSFFLIESDHFHVSSSACDGQ